MVDLEFNYVWSQVMQNELQSLAPLEKKDFGHLPISILT